MSLVVSVVICQVEVCATGQSLVLRSSTECGVSECDFETSAMSWPRPTRAVEHEKKKTFEENIKDMFQERNEDQTVTNSTP